MFSFMRNISSTELLVIALILTLFFGRKTIIGLGKTGGESFKEIKKIKKSFTEAVDDEEPDKNEKEVSK